MTRLIALLAVLAAILVVSWRVYADSQALGVLIFAAGMIMFVLVPYYQLMGVTRDNDKQN